MFVFQGINRHKVLRYIISFLVVLLISLNIFQYYQNLVWVYPGGPVTKESYWTNFLSLKPKPNANISREEAIYSHEIFNDLESKTGWRNEKTLTNIKAFSGETSSQLSSSDTISVVAQKFVKPYLKSQKAKILVSAQIQTDNPKCQVKLVIDFISHQRSYFYSEFPLKRYLIKNKWVYVEFASEIPLLIEDYDKVKVYFYKTTCPGNIFIDDIKIEFLSFNEDQQTLGRINVPDHNIDTIYSFYHDFESEKKWIKYFSATGKVGCFTLHWQLYRCLVSYNYFVNVE